MEVNRFQTAIAAFDAYHGQDPNTDVVDGRTYPQELLYAKRMTERLASFHPGADEVIQLAARCQHIGRWEIPRERFPMDRKGYLEWRNEEKLRHARIAEEILLKCGYESGMIEQIKVLILKKELSTNRNSQLLEDVACLVFLEHYADGFSEKHSDDKMVDILRKTMKKMSDAAKSASRQINMSPKLRSLVEQAASR